MRFTVSAAVYERNGLVISLKDNPIWDVRNDHDRTTTGRLRNFSSLYCLLKKFKSETNITISAYNAKTYPNQNTVFFSTGITKSATEKTANATIAAKQLMP